MNISPELLLRLEMQDLQDRYTGAIDEDRLEEWPKLFVEDCLYEIVSRENEEGGFPAPVMYCDSAGMLRDRVISLRNANIYAKPNYRHFTSGLACRMEGDEVVMTSSYVVINTHTDGSSFVYQAGSYRDRVVQTASGWRFKSKRVIYDTLRVQTLLAYPV